TVMSSSRRNAWLAVMIESLLQRMPLEGCRRPCTATTDLPTVAAVSASSFDNDAQMFSAMILTPFFFSQTYLTMEQSRIMHISYLGSFAHYTARSLTLSANPIRSGRKGKS